MPTDLSARSKPDACPGALRVHRAADGGLVRVRIPGGTVTAGQLEELSWAAAELGEGSLQLTSRANLQIRGLQPGAEGRLADRLAAIGLLPSATHERVRNVVASPLSGCDSRGRLDVHPLVGELDRGLCADPGLAALPGRFLFTVDDGRGDVIGLDGDVGLLATGPDRFALLLAGIRTGVEVPRESAVRTALACAAAFLEERERQGSGAWRLAELPDGVAAVLDRLGADDLEVEAGVATSVATAGSNGNLAAGSSASGPGLRVGYGIQPDASSDVDALPARMQPVGIVEGASGQASLVVGAPLGRLSRDQGRAVAALAHDTTGWARITPWRSVVVPVTTAGDKAAPPGPALRGRSGGGRQWAAERLEMLAGLGMVTDPSSPLLGVTACTGWPGCASGLADVQADARRVVSMAAPGGLPVHWVGCGHRCGRPAGRAVEVLATADGYQVSAGDHPLGTFGTAEAAGAAADEARQT